MNQRVAVISYHTCPLLPPGAGKAGGMNVYVRELGRHLGAMGVAVDIFTRCHLGHDDEVAPLGDNARVVHLKAGPSDTDVEGLYPHVHPFAQELLRFQQDQGVDYDVVHSHYWLSGLAGRCLVRKWRVPHVITFHTLAAVKRQARPGEREPLYRVRMEKDLMRSAERTIASSGHERQAMVQLYGAPEHRVEVIPCGVDLSLFKPLDMREARKRLGLNGEKVLLYVGRIEPLKGVELLLRTAAIMKGEDHLKVLVVGGDPTKESETARLKGLTDEMGLEGIIDFVGQVDQRLLPTYYAAADVCVVPSYYESFGLVALESMACGTPVVASRVGGLPTVIKHGSTGYLMSRRCPEPFADTLAMILYNNSLRQAMSQAAIEVAENLGWDSVAERVAHLYQTLSRGGSEPAVG